MQGEFRERVEKIRGYWRIDDPPAQLPPESEDFLLPPSIVEGAEDLSSLLAVAANHPHVLLSRPDRLSSVRRSLIARWESDLRYVLRADEVPDVHLAPGRRRPRIVRCVSYGVHPRRVGRRTLRSFSA